MGIVDVVPYNVEDTLRVILVLGTLGVEKEAFPALGGLGHIGVSNFMGPLVAQISRQVVVIQRLFIQPEVLLGEDQTSATMLALIRFPWEEAIYLRPGPLKFRTPSLMGFEVISSSPLPTFSSLIGLTELALVGAAAVTSPAGATCSTAAPVSVVVGSVVAVVAAGVSCTECWTSDMMTVAIVDEDEDGIRRLR